MNKLRKENLENLALESMKKLVDARQFCEIDHKILGLSINDSVSGDYFSELLSLESKRLKFKEDITGCKKEKTMPGMKA